MNLIAHALGEAGARVIVSSRKEKDLVQAVASLQDRGISASHIAADCGDESSIQKLADQAIAETGAVDILVNNAGAAWVGTVMFASITCVLKPIHFYK